MNVTKNLGVGFGRTLIAVAAVSALLVSCASAPVKSPGAAPARDRLTQLQTNPDLATRAPVAIKEAEAAVSAAEVPETNEELLAHRIYMAERKVDTAVAQAETRFAEDQRTVLSEQRERARLDARTREADAAKRDAEAAKIQTEAAKTQTTVALAEIAKQKLLAEKARTDAEAAQQAVANSAEQTAELQRQIAALQARPTERGLVLTLGDMLFTSGKADLKTADAGNLDKLVTFLNKYPERNVVIEGYTDSVGSDDYNQTLSLRRADSVKSYLIKQGVTSGRLSASGMGESAPVADNDSADGRQRNRRVEIIIDNPPDAPR